MVKAGFVQKRKGVWHLTEEGEEASKWDAPKLREVINARYKAWKEKQVAEEGDTDDGETDGTTEEEALRSITTEQVESLANHGIEQAIRKLNPYEFQDLVAALLRGMGYHTPFVAPRGKDGGVDVIAYKDPLGTEAPAVLCQVKHRPDSAAGIADVQRLIGALQVGKNVGLFVTSGRYSNDALHAARTSHIHIELVDISRFVELWIEHYDSMDEEDRALLRLRPVYVLSE